MNLSRLILFCITIITLSSLVGCGNQSPNKTETVSEEIGKVITPVEDLHLEPIDFMTVVTHHQSELYTALEENSKVEKNQKTLAYEGALFKILQTSNSGKYGGAKRLINRYFEQYPEDPRLEFQLGMQLFRLGRFEQAVPYFIKLNSAKSKPLREAAQFFLAAASSGFDPEQSAVLLYKISADNKHSFSARAKAIIEAK